MPEHTPAPTPSRAVYGFVMYLSFRILFIIYLVWAIIPQSWLAYLNITCFPPRYWAVAVPICIITAIIIFAFVIYPSINLCMTPEFNDINTIMDKTIEQRNNCKQNVKVQDDTGDCICKDKTKCGKQEYLKISEDFHLRCVPSAKDLDVIDVSKILYSKFKSS